MLQYIDILATESTSIQCIKTLILIICNIYKTPVYKFLYTVCIAHKILHNHVVLFSYDTRRMVSNLIPDDVTGFFN
jgi:hypothetical protein